MAVGDPVGSTDVGPEVVGPAVGVSVVGVLVGTGASVGVVEDISSTGADELACARLGDEV